jgi:autotransporter-associated beta strand protein
LTVVALLAASLGVQAATHTWDAGGTNASWGTAANWDNNTLPTWGNQADLIFNMDVGSVDTLFLGADRQFRSILFGSNLTGGTDSVFDIRNFSAISGGAVNMLFNGGTGNSSITVQNSSLARVRLGQNNSGPTAFQTDTDLHHNSAATVLQFDGATTGAGKLNVYGVGRTTFTRNNSFGGLNLYGGSVVAWNSATALGTNSVTLGQTGSSTNVSLFFGSNVTNANAITVSSGSGTRTIGNTDGITQLPGFSVITGNAVLNSTIDLSAGKDLTFDVNAYAATTTDRLTASGAISGTGGIVKTGTGVLEISGVNTYSGRTTVEGGTLSLKANQTVGDDSELILGSSAALKLDFAGTETVKTLSLDGGITFLAPGTYTAAQLSALGSGTYSGNGTLTVLRRGGKLRLIILH